MHADVLPETSPVTVDVQIEALGLSAPEVEELVTVPLEKNLFEGIMGVTDTTSDSIAGLADIELHFAPGTDLYRARQLVQERLNSAFILPNVSTPPVMVQPTSTTSDTVVVGLTSSKMSIIDLSVLSRWTIVPKLLGLAGVANVSTYGQADRQLQVLVDPAKMAAQNVTLAEVIATAGNSQLVSPITYLQGSVPGTGGYIEDGNQRLDIRHILPFGTPGNMNGLPIAGARPGITIGDIGQVVNGHQPLIGDAEVHGQQGLVLVIQKLPSASVPQVTSEVQQALASLNLGASGVTVDTSLFQQSTYTTTALVNVGNAAIIAGVLAIIALLLLLLSLRAAFVAVVSIGVSLTTALLVLYGLGYTLNALVLLGLLLALGVVVADATSGGLRRGLSAGLIVVLLTMVPLLASSGTTASFLRPMAVAFMVAAVTATVVAVTVAVALASVLEKLGPRTPRFSASLRDRLASGYQWTLRGAAKMPRALLAVFCVAVAGAVLAAIPSLHPSQPSFQDRNLVVHWTTAPGTSLTEMNRLAGVATSELKAIPGVQDVGATLGRAVLSDQIVNTNSGELWVTMKPDANYGSTLAAIRHVAGGTPGIQGTVSTYESQAMGGVLASPPNQVMTRIYGTDYPTLEKVASQVRGIMAGVSGVSSPQVQQPTQQPTIDVKVNLDEAAKYGVAAGDIRREAAVLTEGLTVGNFFVNQEVFDVTVQAIPSVRQSVQDVDNLLLDTVDGGHVRLDQVASVTVQNEPVDIKHENTALYLDVTAGVSGRSASAVAADISSRLKSLSLPATFSTTVLSGAQLDATIQSGAAPGDTVVPGTSFPQFLAYILAALLGIFLITQAAVGSWRLGLIAFGSVIVSMSGAMLVVYTAHWTGSLGAVAGLVGVFALAARQAISTITRIREGHEDIPRAASVAAGHAVTVAVVTAAALLPFAISRGTAGLELLWPAACVILGGLVTLTLVSLLVLPIACLWLGPKVLAPPSESAEDEVVVPAPRASAAIESDAARSDPAGQPAEPVAAPTSGLATPASGLAAAPFEAATSASGAASPAGVPTVPAVRAQALQYQSSGEPPTVPVTLPVAVQLGNGAHPGNGSHPGNGAQPPGAATGSATEPAARAAGATAESV